MSLTKYGKHPLNSKPMPCLQIFLRQKLWNQYLTRFVKLSGSEIETLLEDSVPNNTKRSTIHFYDCNIIMGGLQLREKPRNPSEIHWDVFTSRFMIHYPGRHGAATPLKSEGFRCRLSNGGNVRWQLPKQKCFLTCETFEAHSQLTTTCAEDTLVIFCIIFSTIII